MLLLAAPHSTGSGEAYTGKVKKGLPVYELHLGGIIFPLFGEDLKL